MKKKSTRIKVISVLGAAIVLSACSGNGGDSVAEDCKPFASFPTIKKGELTIVALNGMPKLEAKPGSAPADGISGKNISAFADAACLKRNWMPLAGTAAAETMASGKADLGAADWVKSPERGKVMQQSATVWYDPIAVSSKTGLATIEDLKGKKVGTTSGAAWLPGLQAALGKKNVRLYDLPASGFADLQNGRIDAMFQSGSESLYRQKTEGWDDIQVKILTPDSRYPDITKVNELNWPHIKNNPKMDAAIDEFIEKLRSDGTMKKVLDSYGLTDPIFLNGSGS